MRRGKKRKSIYVFTELCPFEVFWWKLCPLYNFTIVENIFLKVCKNINHHLEMCREKQP